MIVDCHAHVGLNKHMPALFLEEMLQPFFRSSGKEIPAEVYEGIDPAAMMKEYKQVGVDKVFIYGVSPREPRSFGRDPARRTAAVSHVPNDYVDEVHREFPDMTVPVMAFNPAYEGAKVEENVEYAVKELGAKALKIYPTYNHYRPDDRELCWPFFQKAQDLAVPVIVHQSWTTTVDAPMKFQRPAQLDDVGREFRELTVVMAHFGVPWVDEAMCLISKHDNFYADVSFWTILERPELIAMQFARMPGYGCTYDRIMWGTDYPLTTPAESLKILREDAPAAAERMGLPWLSDEELALILGGNATRLYRLE